MPATITRLPVRKTPATPEDAFAADLVAGNPEIAARITAALLRSLDASVAAILKASSP